MYNLIIRNNMKYSTSGLSIVLVLLVSVGSCFMVYYTFFLLEDATSSNKWWTVIIFSIVWYIFTNRAIASIEVNSRYLVVSKPLSFFHNYNKILFEDVESINVFDEVNTLYLHFYFKSKKELYIPCTGVGKYNLKSLIEQLNSYGVKSKYIDATSNDL